MRFSDRVRLARSEAILDAAQRGADRKGWPGVTIDDVASEAGVAKGTVYLHYDGKDGLMSALAERAVRQIVAVFDEEAHRDGDPLHQLRAIFRRLVGEVQSHRAVHTLAHCLSCQIATAREREVVLARPFSDVLTQFVRNGQARGALAADLDASAAAVTFVALALTPAWVLDSNPPIAALDDVWTIYERAIGAADTTREGKPSDGG